MYKRQDLFNASGNLLENDDIDFSKFFSHDNPLLEINLSNNNLSSNININLPKIIFNKINLSNNNLTGFSLIGANNNLNNQYSLNSVSYTHLDVYKRQEDDTVLPTLLLQPYIENAIIHGAVSYTHLDVYKRQL